MLSAADLRAVVERVVALARPERVYLFGSYARGTAHAASDADLLLVGPSALPRAARCRDVVAVLRAYPVDFDVVHFTPAELADELAQPHSFAATIMPSAVLVYDAAAPASRSA